MNVAGDAARAAPPGAWVASFGLDDKPRVREDLIISEQQLEGKRSFVIKQPTTGAIFRVGPSAFKYLKLLDGSRTIGEAIELVLPRASKDSSNARTAMLALTEKLASVRALEGVNAPQQAGPPQAPRFMTLINKYNPLMIRLPVVDPMAFLRRVERFVFPLFHPAAIAVVLTAVCAGIGLLLFGGRNPLYFFAAFQTFQGWLWIYPALALTIVLHELGHALACRRYGGNVPRMGFLLYLFFPGCFTDVSDSWLMPRSQRVMVALAGLYFDSISWCVATFTWYWTRPYSWLNQGAFIFAVILSSRIVFNLIPFLRLDGYFVLSDLLERPNLRQKSFAYLAGFLPVVGKRYAGAMTVAPKDKLLLLSYGLISVVASSLALAWTCRWTYRMLANWLPAESVWPLVLTLAVFGVPLIMGTVLFFVGLERMRFYATRS